MFSKKIRVTILLIILAVVGLNTVLSKARSTDWDQPLWVIIYPINADGSAASKRYIRNLTEDHFNSIEQMMSKEAKRYQLRTDQPVSVKLASEIQELPPAPPISGGGLSAT
ncbi:MAG: hypothetical protein HOM11_16215 [Methylococcales bacterium]|jgi:hypothetical protein|nr:hypothetical protein [Methylococcales bacterium]MBT7445699.1 hypothetical protein [Methylococcales bacterium]